MRIARARASRLSVIYAFCIVGLVTGCASSPSSHQQLVRLPAPCTLLTQPIAAQITGDIGVTNDARNVAEAVSEYVACIYSDPVNEANSAAVQIKREARHVSPATLLAAATFFSAGEAVQPYRLFSVVGIGDGALGESTPGVAFIVFSAGSALVFVGAASSSRTVASLRAGVGDLARRVAAAISPV